MEQICTEQDYRAALRELSCHFNDQPEPGAEDGDRFAILLTLVEAYEAKHFPIGAPDPLEAIRFRMEQAEPIPVEAPADPRVRDKG